MECFSKCIGFFMWKDVPKFVNRVTWNVVVNVKDSSNDRDTGHLYQDFMWLHL